MRVHVSANTGEYKGRRLLVQVIAIACECRCVRVCMYELVIVPTPDKTMREMPPVMYDEHWKILDVENKKVKVKQMYVTHVQC